MITKEQFELPVGQLVKQSPVPLTVLDTPHQVMQHFARSIADEIKNNNRISSLTRLILPVVPVDHYPILSE